MKYETDEWGNSIPVCAETGPATKVSNDLIEKIIIEHNKRFDLPIAVSEIEFIIRAVLEDMQEWGGKTLLNSDKRTWLDHINEYAKKEKLR